MLFSLCVFFFIMKGSVCIVSVCVRCRNKWMRGPVGAPMVALHVCPYAINVRFFINVPRRQSLLEGMKLFVGPRRPSFSRSHKKDQMWTAFVQFWPIQKNTIFFVESTSNH